MATQPCPCDYFTDPSKECSCTPLQIQRYMAKISGPLLDRIDLHIEVPAVKYEELTSRESGERSETIRRRVVASRDLQSKRFRGKKEIKCNSDMHSMEIHQFCRLDDLGNAPSASEGSGDKKRERERKGKPIRGRWQAGSLAPPPGVVYAATRTSRRIQPTQRRLDSSHNRGQCVIT
jgi:hypothetical protein